MAEQRVILIDSGSRTNQRILVDLNPDGSFPRSVTFPDMPEQTYGSQHRNNRKKNAVPLSGSRSHAPNAGRFRPQARSR
jgi:hypothetical protein